jgi:hypothetical protein
VLNRDVAIKFGAGLADFMLDVLLESQSALQKPPLMSIVAKDPGPLGAPDGNGVWVHNPTSDPPLTTNILSGDIDEPTAAFERPKKSSAKESSFDLASQQNSKVHEISLRGPLLLAGLVLGAIGVIAKLRKSSKF